MNILVVPTIREDCIKRFIDVWKGVFHHVIVVQDNPEKTFDIKGVEHLCWQDIRQDLGEDEWIISNRDCGIKCFGIYRAWKAKADYIFVLDDDCYPLEEENFVLRHIGNLEKTVQWTENIPGVRMRGLPYKNFGTLKNVKFSMGLWKGIPDLDAPSALLNEPQDFSPPDLTRVIPHGQYFNFCGMNFALKSDVASLCYFPFMGVRSPYARFDDMWFGVVAKKICDHLGYYITCGKPFIRHDKASNVFSNLIKEAPGIQLNEIFWEAVDQVEITGKCPVECMGDIGRGLESHSDPYISKVGKAIQIWTKLFIQ